MRERLDLRRDRRESHALLFESMLLLVRVQFGEHVAGLHLLPEREARVDDPARGRGLDRVARLLGFEPRLGRDLVERDAREEEPRAPRAEHGEGHDEPEHRAALIVRAERAHVTREGRGGASHRL